LLIRDLYPIVTVVSNIELLSFKLKNLHVRNMTPVASRSFYAAKDCPLRNGPRQGLGSIWFALNPSGKAINSLFNIGCDGIEDMRRLANRINNVEFLAVRVRLVTSRNFVATHCSSREVRHLPKRHDASPSDRQQLLRYRAMSPRHTQNDVLISK
jgi:hypothetical protein